MKHNYGRYKKTKELTRNLKSYQRLEVTSCLKGYNSAVEALKRRQDGSTFDISKQYSLSKLHDLVGVRVLSFPHSLHTEIEDILKSRFPDWISDPVVDKD